jgi:hypothetical protein
VLDPHPQTLAGETLDLDPVAPAPDEEPPDPIAPTSPPAPARAQAPLPAPAATASTRGAAAAATGSAAARPPPPLYGAVGDRVATDLVTAFTRTFPQAASAEPSWSAAPLGAAGRAEVTFLLDERGEITGTSITGAPSPALRKGLERTLLVLAPRMFTAHAPVTRLRVVARVASDEVHDGLHGDVFALSGGSFSGSVGTAFFALPPSSGSSGGAGRRIDLEVRLLP